MSYKISYSPLGDFSKENKLTPAEILKAARVSVDEEPFEILESIDSVRDFVANIISKNELTPNNRVVYLVSIQDDVIVTENNQLLQELFECKLNSVYPFYQGDEIFIQEYANYEDAYNVALSIKETTGIAYA